MLVGAPKRPLGSYNVQILNRGTQAMRHAAARADQNKK